jgi:hypothetical protein
MRAGLFALSCLVLVVLAQVPGGVQMGRRAGGAAKPTGQAREGLDPAKLCKLEGRTVNAKTGEPVPRASLTLMIPGGNATPLRSRSDNEGRFLIENIPSGTYRLRAERVGFLWQWYGSRAPGGSGAPLNLSEGQQLKELELRLMPQGVILGRVIDEEGDPLPRASVMAWSQGGFGTAAAGFALGMRGGTGQGVSGMSATSNDIGEYRIAGLSPGRYLVVASSQGSRMIGGAGAERGGILSADQGPMPTFYPSTTDFSAALPIDVAAGQEVAGIDIAIRTGSLFRIQGRVMGTGPQEVAGVMLSLIPRGAGAMQFTGRETTGVKPDGSFEMTRVPPGAYLVRAQRVGRGGGGMVGKTMLDVTSDITGLVMPLAEPLSVSVTVKLEGQQGPPMQSLSLGLYSADGMPNINLARRAAGTGAFTIAPVFPDMYYLNASGLPEGAYVKSVKLANQEVSDKGIDLTNFRATAALDVLLSPNGATLEGTVSADDKPATGSYVAVLADPLRAGQPYLNKFATADQDGKFTIKGLAPGGYRVYAFEEPTPDLSQEPSLAVPFEPKAVKINLDEGANQHVELTALKADDARR